MQLLRKITTLGKDTKPQSRNVVADTNKLGASDSTFKKIADLLGLDFNVPEDQKLMRSETETYLGAVIEEKILQKDGSKQINTYVQGQFLGKGGFARVYQIKN